MGSVSVAFRTHPVNGWWLKTFTDPFVELDGTVHRASWRGPVDVPADPGTHDVRTFVRYRGVISGDRGAASGVVAVPASGVVRVEAANGVTNGSPFVPRVTA